MFGAMTFGSLSDRYCDVQSSEFRCDRLLCPSVNDLLAFCRFGRRTTLLVSYLSGMLFAVASAFSTTYVMFAVLRFFTGFCITGIVIVSTVLSNIYFLTSDVLNF